MKAFEKLQNYAVILICLSLATNVMGQGKPKTTSGPVNGQKASPVKTVSNQATVTMSQVDMMSVVNGGQSFSVIPGSFNPNQTADLNNSEMLQDMAAKNLSDQIFGTKSSYEYGITYWSGPVEETYNHFIAPHVDIFTEMNEDIYDPVGYKMNFVLALANILEKVAVNEGFFTFSLKSREKFRELIISEFYTDQPFSEESLQTDYYREPLVKVAFKMPNLSQDRFQDFLKFMNQITTRQVCVIAVMVAKSAISDLKNQSQLTKDLYLAKSGFLFRPLTYFGMKKSPFDVYALKMEALQLATQQGKAHEFYDAQCKCPTETAFKPGKAVKVNSGSVISSYK